jgi:hypothetical protein
MASLLTPRELDVSLPPPTGNKDVDDYLLRLHRAVAAALANIFDDLALGYHRRTILTAAPALADLEEGQAILVDDAVSVRRVYYRMNDTLRFVDLT